MLNNLREYIEKEMMYVYIAIVSIILFFTITHFIDKHNVNTHKPPLTTPIKSGLFVLCFISTTVVFSLITEESTVEVPYINQEIDTGFPEF